MIRNNLSWINLNAGSSGGSGGGGVSDYNDLANRPIISMTGTSQNPLKLWNLSTGLYLLNGYVYYNTTNTRECVNLFVSITAQIQNGKYVLSAFVPSWEGHHEYIKANSTSTDYTNTQILKMLTEDDVLTLTNEVEYTPTTDYHPSTKKYVDEAMQSVMEEFAKMGVNEQDIKTLIAENRRRDIAIQALLNETADKNVTIEEDTHTISLDYSMEDGMATVNSIEGSTLVNVSKTVDEVYVTKSQDRVEQTKVANTIGEQNGKICPIIEGDTLVNVCDQKKPIAITKSYTVENSGNHIALQGEYDGSCRPVIQGNTLVNLIKSRLNTQDDIITYTVTSSDGSFFGDENVWVRDIDNTKTHTIILNILENTVGADVEIYTYGTYAYFPFQCINIPIGTTGMQIYTTTQHVENNQSPSDWLCFPLGHNSGATIDGVFKYQAMLFEGDLTQTPELIPTEYVEGLKNSFEDNVVTQAMVDSGEESAENLGKYKVQYKVTGKNKFDGNWELGSINASGENKVNESTYPNAVRNTNLIKVKSSTNYICNYPLNIYWYDKDKNFISFVSPNPAMTVFTSPSNASYLRISRSSNESDVQIEEGTQATEYEPYNSYTKTFYLNSPLLEGDTIEDVNGVATHVKRYGKVVLDGRLTFLISAGGWENKTDVCTFEHFKPTPTAVLDSTRTLYADTIPTYNFIEQWNYSGTTGIEGLSTHINGGFVLSIKRSKLKSQDIYGLDEYLKKNPITVVYELASPIYEPISTESILCDSYVNGHLDFDSAVPIEKVVFKEWGNRLNYLKGSMSYAVQFESDNEGMLERLWLGGSFANNISIKKGINTIKGTTIESTSTWMAMDGIGFNASNIVVTEATDKDFDYFNGVQSTFEENLVTDENNPHYGKYRVIYRTKSSDGNASTVKSVYLNSPLLNGDELLTKDGKLYHYHKMGMVVFDGSEDWSRETWSNILRFKLPHVENAATSNALDKNLLYCDTISLGYGDIAGLDYIRMDNSSNFHVCYIYNKNLNTTIDEFKQWLQANPTTVVYELAEPYYEEISSNPKDTVVDFYANGTLEVQSAVYPLSMEFTSFEEELTYLYASTVYTVQFEANGNATVDITLGGTTVTNQEIIHGLNRIQVTTPSALVDNKLIIDGCGDCKISKVVVTNSIEEFEYFEGMKSAFEDKQNEDGTYTVEIVVYNAPIRLNKDKE